MATYAALVSLMNVLIRIQNPNCPVSFDQTQIRSLFDKASSLVEFLEAYCQRVSKDLERRMNVVAFAAEDTIESYLVDQILVRSAEDKDDEYSLSPFCEDLEKLIQELDLIIQEAMEVKAMTFEKDQQPKRFVRVGSFAPPSGNNKMVGLDEELIRLMDQLTTDQPSRQIIPVVGMGGIGKTTLVRSVYNHPYVRDHFQIRAWVRISQDFTVRSIIRPLLRDIGFRGMGKTGDEELGEKLYKGLWGRKYLIVLDDIWSNVVCDEVRRFFPDNGNGSRILLTTRLLNVALHVGSYSPYEMKLLDDDKSWYLLSQTIFGQDVCPTKLEKLGMKISRCCKGLPLAIVVIGGLLKVSEKTLEYWANVAENVIPIISTENDGHCSEILSLSYNHLPIHLKPCFLYMSTFIEDESISTSELIKLWVADGFLNVTKDKTLEEVALEYLHDLIERNLIMVPSPVLNGRRIEYCTIHDFLREFCSRQAQIEGFLCPVSEDELNFPQTLESERRLVYQPSGNESNSTLPPTPLARSFFCNKWGSPNFATPCRLLRVLHVFSGNELQIDTTQLFNLRYLACQLGQDDGAKLLSSICLFWNLEVLIVSGSYENLILPSRIWEFTNLKYLIFNRIILPDPVGAHPYYVLDNLRALKGIKNFNFTNEVINRIPNIIELSIYYDMDYVSENPDLMSRSIINLARHQRIQALRCEFLPSEQNSLCVFELENLTFSPFLRELELSESGIPWEYMTIVGSLPNLEMLTLECDAFRGEEWEPIEGEFECLKCLSISGCELRIWRAESSHFPRLERLFLEFMDLEEIPLDIGEIASLELINIQTDKKSLVLSAKEILDEREDQGNHDLVVEGLYFMDKGYEEEKKMEEKRELEKMQMENNNFQVQLFGLEHVTQYAEDSDKDGASFKRLLVNMWKPDDADRKLVQKQLVKMWRSEEGDRIIQSIAAGIAGAMIETISTGIAGAVSEKMSEVGKNIADAFKSKADAFKSKVGKDVSEGIAGLLGRAIVIALLITGFIIVVIFFLFLLLIYVLYKSYYG